MLTEQTFTIGNIYATRTRRGIDFLYRCPLTKNLHWAFWNVEEDTYIKFDVEHDIKNEIDRNHWYGMPTSVFVLIAEGVESDTDADAIVKTAAEALSNQLK